MKKDIYFPASLCPLHLWHEDLIKTTQDKSWNDLYFSIKAGEKTLNEVNKSNKDWKLDHIVDVLTKQEAFLSLEDRYKIIEEIYPNSNMWNDTRDEILSTNFDGIVLWSDNFNLIVESIKHWRKQILKFKKIYLYERIWYKTSEYKKLFEKEKIDTEVIYLWKAKHDIRWREMVEQYHNWWLESIKKFISSDVYKILRDIKKNK